MTLLVHIMGIARTLTDTMDAESIIKIQKSLKVKEYLLLLNLYFWMLGSCIKV